VQIGVVGPFTAELGDRRVTGHTLIYFLAANMEG